MRVPYAKLGVYKDMASRIGIFRSPMKPKLSNINAPLSVYLATEEFQRKRGDVLSL